MFQGLPLRVLFLGNSLTRELPSLLQLMSRSRGALLETAVVARDAATLADHREDTQAGRLLRAGDWDIVVLQENSRRALPDAANEARRLDALIRAAGARTALFSTSRFHAGLAAEIGAIRVPVAQAWERAARERPELELKMDDGVHFNALGTYLNACVCYARFFPGRLDASNAAVAADLEAVCGLDPDPAALAFLRSIAAAARAEDFGIQPAVALRHPAPAV